MGKDRPSRYLGKTALLVIDVQKAFFFLPSPVYRAEELLRNIRRLVERAHLEGVQIIYVQHSSDDLLIGSEGWQIHQQLQPQAGDLIIRKLQPNSFAGTNLADELEAKDIHCLVITGFATQGCVKATCLGAKELGYDVTLVQDAHSNTSRNAAKLIQDWNTRLRERGIVRLQTAAELAF